MKKAKISVSEAVDLILSAGLSVMERENHSDSCSGSNHLTIAGGKRIVEYWPTTGTVYANAVKGQFKAVRGSGHADAIRIAKHGN